MGTVRKIEHISKYKGMKSVFSEADYIVQTIPIICSSLTKENENKKIKQNKNKVVTTFYIRSSFCNKGRIIQDR